MRHYLSGWNITNIRLSIVVPTTTVTTTATKQCSCCSPYFPSLFLHISDSASQSQTMFVCRIGELLKFSPKPAKKTKMKCKIFEHRKVDNGEHIFAKRLVSVGVLLLHIVHTAQIVTTHLKIGILWLIFRILNWSIGYCIVLHHIVFGSRTSFCIYIYIYIYIRV